MATKNLNLFGTYLRSGRSVPRSRHRRTAQRSLLHILTHTKGTVRYRDLWKLAYQMGFDEVSFSTALRDLRHRRLVRLSPTTGSVENPAIVLDPSLKSVVDIL